MNNTYTLPQETAFGFSFKPFSLNYTSKIVIISKSDQSRLNYCFFHQCKQPAGCVGYFPETLTELSNNSAVCTDGSKAC